MPKKTTTKKGVTKKTGKTRVVKKMPPISMIPLEPASRPDIIRDEAPTVTEPTSGADLDSPIESDANGGKSRKPERYFEGVGRRKTATARVRLYTRSGEFMVNGKLWTDCFRTNELQKIAEEALQKMKLTGRFKVLVHVRGGGLHAQAEAVRHGLARSLTKFNPDFRKRLKRAGFLRRDPRAKERKKFGLKKARRAPQWAKR